MSDLPERYQDYARPTLGQDQAPAHHRPPNIAYMPDGTPVHFTIGQPQPPQNIIVQLPEQAGMSAAQRELVVNVVLLLVVAVVLTGCACAVTVIMGGTLMGIIGVVSANIPMVAVSLVAVVVAVGWAATKLGIKPGGKTSKKK
jgi:hypothetical protein